MLDVFKVLSWVGILEIFVPKVSWQYELSKNTWNTHAPSIRTNTLTHTSASFLHIHNGLLLNYKKECIWVSSNEVDETGAYYTQWNKQKEKHKYSILMHINGI